MATTPKRSASRPRRAFRAALWVAWALAAGLPATSPAQVAPAPTSEVIVVDMARVLREVEIARALRVIELEARRALRASLDAVKVSLEAEEAELVQLRKTLPKDQFDARVRAFDQRVRTERQDAQDKGAALQARFTSARSALEAAIRPVLAALMRERGAVVALDRSAVLVVADPQEATDELIVRINAARPASGAQDLVPPAAPPQ